MFFPSEVSSTATKMFSAYASFAGTMMMVRSMASEAIPDPVRSYLHSAFRSILRRFLPITDDSKLTLIIEEYITYEQNEIFDAAEIYLRSKINPRSESLKVGKIRKQKHIITAPVKGQKIFDSYNDVELTWKFVCSKPENKNEEEETQFELTFALKFKDIVLNSYLPYVISEAEKAKKGENIVRLYSRDCPHNSDDENAKGPWSSIHLDHPSTFDTLAMDPEMKKFIIDDLERFLRRKEFYKRVGKAWKRGYLLYGPPGTGKSSLIAAMANYLKFNIYDLELTSIWGNSDLKKTLLTTTNRSILVIENIDCTAPAKDRAKGNNGYSDKFNFTLSGLLNFIDGLWTSAGEERILIFTTNHKDRLDPALLRPGRMDVHINMSYCTAPAFRQLVCNYLGDSGKSHHLVGEIEGIIESSEVTPAEIAEELIRSDEADSALQSLLDSLKRKKTEKENKMEEEEISKETEVVESKMSKAEEEGKKKVKNSRRKNQRKS